MLRTTLPLLLIGLASPSFAQAIDPAMVGSGSQTQSVELAKGAVSISVDSAGSLSLGRGADSTDGHLGISVNDANVSLGTMNQNDRAPGLGRPDDGEATTLDSGFAPKADANVMTAIAADPGAETCALALASEDELSEALEGDYWIELREVNCPAPAPGLQTLIASSPVFFDALSAAGAPMESMVAITIDSSVVIVDYAE